MEKDYTQGQMSNWSNTEILRYLLFGFIICSSHWERETIRESDPPVISDDEL